MTEKEYIKMDSEIDEQMAALRKKRIALREKYIEEYIEDNKPFPIGSKVRVFDKSNGSVQYGFVVGYELSYYGAKICPKVKKMKKDGTMSQVNMCIWSCMTIEACND